MGPLAPAAPRRGDPLADLNPEQRRAAAHGDGPLLIVAGAGTGKTRTLAARVGHLLAGGVAPERVLLLTFTRQAARELLSRVRAWPGVPDGAGERVWGGTFHAVATRLLRVHADRMGLAPGFSVLDRADAEDLLDLAREELLSPSPSAAPAAAGEARAVARFPQKATCLAVYSRCVNAEETVDEVVARRFPWVSDHAAALKELFRRYEERKEARAVLDLDDLLVWWRALVEDPVLGPEVAARFDHVLVDEYQDTNRLQRAVLLGLVRGARNLTCVGDDAQAIYGFRAATVKNMLDFEQDFPGAAVVRLERNYRSTQPILDASNALIAQATTRHDKTLVAQEAGGARPLLVRCLDERAEADHVIKVALERLEEGTPLRHQAVLFRTAYHSDLLEVELGRRKIPFRKYGGLRFVDAAHVKDALAFLRIVENPADEPAWFRVLKLLDGVGPKTARRVLDHLAAERFLLGAAATCKVPPGARPSWTALLDLLRALTPGPFGLVGEGPPVHEALERVRAFCEPIVARRYDRPAARLHDLEALAKIAQGAPSRRELLADLAMEPPTFTGDLAGTPSLEEDWLVLSTIHSAKGLEWDAVTLLHAADGCIPSDLATGDPEEIDEERRLLYVAMTRARRHLTVLAPLRFHVRERQPSDRHLHAPLSRFFTPEVKACFDERSEGATGLASMPASSPGLAASVRVKAKARWS
jgi:DNA helicase-2/ATP-dependent DNA helicase PcrA